MSADTVQLDWSEVIVLFNSLIRNIEFLHSTISQEELDDDDLYEAEEELNDYLMLLTRLRQRFDELPEKGELSEELKKKIRELC